MSVYHRPFTTLSGRNWESFGMLGIFGIAKIRSNTFFAQKDPSRIFDVFPKMNANQMPILRVIRKW